MKTISIVGLSLAVAFLSAMTSDWLLISQNDKSKTFVQVTSVSPRGKLMKAWFRSEFKSPQIRESGSKEYRSMAELAYFNCVERTSAISRLNFFSGYFNSGEVVGQVYFPIEELQFSAVASDVDERAKLNFVCPQK
ncbi:MAG: surface-adhesin E family protein [Bacteroidota bacterium]